MKIISLFLLIINLIYTSEVLAQHMLLFEKRPQSFQQFYYEGKDFPNDQIQTKYTEGYEINALNFKDKRWFIVMKKSDVKITQQYVHNPTLEVLNAKFEDGYEIVDYCYYYNPFDEKLNSLYVLNKVSTKPTNNSYFEMQVISDNIWMVDYPVYLIGMINSATQGSRRVQRLKTYGHPRFSSVMIGYVLAKPVNNPPEQIWVVRPEYPTDYINNKVSENYKIKSIVYSTYDKKWVVLMEKNISNTPWQLVNFDNKTAFQKALDDNYMLVSVF